jgi:methylthioribose-1-phosphate isomerase
VRQLERARRLLAASRPTAVNLTWALERMARLWRGPFDAAALPAALEREAGAIFAEDLQSCLRIGAFGADLLGRALPGKSTLLTHCNTGALATAGHGTALGVIRSAHGRGRLKSVFVDETRPYLQGARLTAWELETERIPYQVITDSMAGHLMKTGEISAVIVGADRIAADGDTANKIGTYPLAVLARHHRIPFYVAAPFSTVDLATASGAQIPIEERDPAEVTTLRGMILTPRGARARHPAFDVTPAALITAIVTDRGVIGPPYRRNLARAARRP